MLLDYLAPDLIRLHVKAEDWQDAIQQGGNLLVKKKICTLKYINACISAAINMGPYMVLAPGIALAHSRPEDGALKIGMSITTLDPAVPFGNKANDPVTLLIIFCGIDHESHINMLQELASFLMDEQNQHHLFTAKDTDELIDYLKKER